MQEGFFSNGITRTLKRLSGEFFVNRAFDHVIFMEKRIEIKKVYWPVELQDFWSICEKYIVKGRKIGNFENVTEN